MYVLHVLYVICDIPIDTTLLAEAAAQAAGVEKEMLKNATGSQDVQSSQHRDAR
jgi:hypothetical protein